MDKASAWRTPAPLFEDPVYGGPTDPVVVYHRAEDCFYLFYTQRRSTGVHIGVSHVHGTAIGVASSFDGVSWVYRGTLSGLDFEPGHNTFWAPEILFAEGAYHMYVSYIRGIPTAWVGEAKILHYTSDDLWHWTYQSALPLQSRRVIDACVAAVAPGRYKMWFKDEEASSHSIAAVSMDLYRWERTTAEITDCAHEGPNVFPLSGMHWMLTDCWDGFAVYHSEDFTHWTRQEGNLLSLPGIRPKDNEIGNHGDVVVCGEHDAVLFYFVSPDLSKEERQGPVTFTYEKAHTVVQAAHLTVRDGRLFCDRDEDFDIAALLAQAKAM